MIDFSKRTKKTSSDQIRLPKTVTGLFDLENSLLIRKLDNELKHTEVRHGKVLKSIYLLSSSQDLIEVKENVNILDKAHFL